MSWSVKTKIATGFGVALALLAAAGLISALSTRQLIARLEDVARGHGRVELLGRVLVDVERLRSQTLRYVITGDPEVLAERRRTLAAIEPALGRLRAEGTPAERRRLAGIEAHARAAIEGSEALVAATRRSGRATAEAMVAAGEGRPAIDALEREVRRLSAQEIALLADREGDARADARGTQGTLLATLLVAFAAVGLALRLILRDVSRGARAEAALRESEARLSAILDTTTAGVTVKDLEGRYLLVNRRFQSLFGRGERSLVGRSDREIFPAEVAAALEDHDRQALAAPAAVSFEETLPLEDGPHTWVSVKSALRRADGTAYALCSISTDITRRQRAEAERARLQAFLDSIVENLPHMVFVKDAAELRFVRFNRAGEQLLGFSRDELLGKSDYDFFPREEADFFTGKDREVLASGTGIDIPEEPIRTRSGETRVLHTKKVPVLNGSGHPEYLLGISEDITERKRMDERLAALNERLRRRTDELEATNQELEAFSYSVSHDLRAPLRHIIGFADLLRRHAGDLDERGRRYLDKIAHSATRMGELIDDLLVFSRMGRAEMRHTAVHLDRLVQEIVAEAAEEARGRTIEWDVRPLPAVLGDPGMLRLALVNLISNAVKYTRPREVARIEIGAERRDDGVVLYVRDNGVGFEGQYRHKLFGVFQRLHGPEEFEGTGIGLANVRRIVHRHGGTAWAEGEAGHGACFYISLPAAAKEAA